MMKYKSIIVVFFGIPAAILSLLLIGLGILSVVKLFY